MSNGGESVSALIAKALEELKEDERPGRMHGNSNGSDKKESPQQATQKPIWEQFANAFRDVAEEALNRLPIDGAAQHDHYIYGMPKRPP